MANKDDQFKLLVIKNQSGTEIITLYVYDGRARKFFPTKEINPNQEYVHYEKTAFKFEIFAKSLVDKTEKRLQGPEEWKEDKVITITELLECQQENLAEVKNGKQLYLRKAQREQELVPGDLYDMLGLDMKKVRKMNNEDLKKEIKKAWRKQMLIWHPDKNFGDAEIMIHITLAYEILMNDGIRARYHNEFDCDRSFFSMKRWKTILWPERCTEEQKKTFRHTILKRLASIVLIAGGIGLSLGTAGVAAPLTVILGAIFGAGIAGAGVQSMGHTMSKKSVVDGCEWKSWGCKAGIGFVGGAITGGAGVGITQGIVGIGSAAVQSGTVTLGQYVGMGSATGAVGGVMLSLSSDFGKKYVDKEKVTWEQVIFHALCGGAMGAGLGVLVGSGTKFFDGSKASAASATLIGDTVEISAQPGGRSFGLVVAKAILDKAPIAGTKAMLEIQGKLVDERLDDSAENQKLIKHLEALKDTPAHEVNTEQKDNEPATVMIKYISKGAWVSKMIVTYFLNGIENKEEVSGDGKEVHISADATNIEVRFQVMRPVWGDIMKYDRFRMAWCKPRVPHIFRYETAVERTFTLSGSLWYEAVMKVSDEHHEETKEMD